MTLGVVRDSKVDLSAYVRFALILERTSEYIKKFPKDTLYHFLFMVLGYLRSDLHPLIPNNYNTCITNLQKQVVSDKCDKGSYLTCIPLFVSAKMLKKYGFKSVLLNSWLNDEWSRLSSPYRFLMPSSFNSASESVFYS